MSFLRRDRRLVSRPPQRRVAGRQTCLDWELSLPAIQRGPGANLHRSSHELHALKEKGPARGLINLLPGEASNEGETASVYHGLRLCVRLSRLSSRQRQQVHPTLGHIEH